MSLKAAILDSWDRQATIINNIANLIQPEQFDWKVGDDEWPIVEHLCHIHGTRRFWMRSINPDYLNGLERLVEEQGEDNWVPIRDIDFIRAQLVASAKKIHEIGDELLDDLGQAGPYDNPLLFIQHMIWHEGWHTSSIMSALRVNGQEQPEEWEEPNIWGLWRTE